MNNDEYAIIIDCKYAQGIINGGLLQNNMHNNITPKTISKQSQKIT